jgi:hypothetical protein
LKQVKVQNNRKRYLVQMSEYAHVSEPNFWTGDRNPTRYSDTDALRSRGIDVEKLDWHPMPDLDAVFVQPNSQVVAAPSANGGLTIADAKRGLSLKFGVPEEAIQIVING